MYAAAVVYLPASDVSAVSITMAVAVEVAKKDILSSANLYLLVAIFKFGVQPLLWFIICSLKLFSYATRNNEKIVACQAKRCNCNLGSYQNTFK